MASVYIEETVGEEEKDEVGWIVKPYDPGGNEGLNKSKEKGRCRRAIGGKMQKIVTVRMDVQPRDSQKA